MSRSTYARPAPSTTPVRSTERSRLGAYPLRPSTLFLVWEAGPSFPSDPDTSELDALVDLGDEIATLAAHIHAATHRLLTLIAQFDRRLGWERDGHRSCDHWLSFRTGVSLGAARERVRTARALTDLRETSASMARGELSFSQVRALTRVATAENECDLLDMACGCAVQHLERIVRGWRGRTRQDEAARERANHETRTFTVFPDEDGMYVVRGRLEPEVAAVLMKAVDAASDALFRDRGSEVPATHEESRRASRRRRADAVGLIAERALAAGFGSVGRSDGTEAPMSGSRAERYQVVLHVD